MVNLYCWENIQTNELIITKISEDMLFNIYQIKIIRREDNWQE